jgi:hypothetical protein
MRASDRHAAIAAFLILAVPVFGVTAGACLIVSKCSPRRRTEDER